MAKEVQLEELKNIFDDLEDVSETFMRYKQIRKTLTESKQTDEECIDQIYDSLDGYIQNFEKSFSSFKISFIDRLDGWKSKKENIKS